MKSLELIITGVLILHIVNPSDGIVLTSRQLLLVTSNLELLQKSDHPCGPPEVLIPMMRGEDPVRPSQLSLMMIAMKSIDTTNSTDLTPMFNSINNLMEQVVTSSERAAYTAWKTRLEGYVSTINAHYDRFTTLRNDQGPVNVDDWMALATDIEVTMRSNLTAFRAELLNRPNHWGNSTLLNEFIRSCPRVEYSRWPDAFAMNGFFNLFSNMVFTTQLKATVPQVFASLLRNCRGTVRRDNLARLVIEQKEGYLEIVRGLRIALTFLPEILIPWRFPYESLIRGQDYYELANSEQLTVQQFLDPEGHRSCSAAQQAQSLTIQSQSDVCNGTLYDCKYSEWLEVCRLENNNKRYVWFKSAHGNYGEILEDCRGGRIFTYSRERNPLIGRCVCKCKEDVNYISVTPAMTNRQADMVLTGFRFVFENRTLYLQAKQGKLLSRERIDPASEEWVPLPKNPQLVPLNSQNSNFHLGDAMVTLRFIAVGMSLVHYNNGFYPQIFEVAYWYTGGVFGYPREIAPPHRDDPRTYVKFQLSKPVINAKAAEAVPPVLLGGFGIAYDRTIGGISPRINGFEFRNIFTQIENAKF
ncbi:uncharacterized protein LOC135171427 [Diachasmimorpha longicaudata]|uniref:uncharacterized protein LOC135171427 n=1 Tax=Diachasmimorpha longicaudata TaxID=58733 RepID=UPI0030B8CEE6